MEDIATLWPFQDSIDELKQRLQYMTYDLEITRKRANEEMRKNREQTNRLLQLLQAAFKERDEAKAQLNKIQQILPFINNTNNNSIKPCFDELIPFSPDTTLFTNSGLTESQSQSQSQSLSHVSSPVMDSLSYPPPPAPSSSDSTAINGLKPKLETTQMMIIQPNKVTDQGSSIIEKLAKGRPLPQKGKLLEAVVEAGPLLQTLMVAGSLPRWHNPPVVVPYNQIPPVDFKGWASVGGGFSHNMGPEVAPDHSSSLLKGVGTSLHNPNYGQILPPKPMLEFGSASSSGSCLMGGRLMTSAANFDCQIAKRQRIH